jgi:hypothetical protein
MGPEMDGESLTRNVSLKVKGEGLKVNGER